MLNKHIGMKRAGFWRIWILASVAVGVWLTGYGKDTTNIMGGAGGAERMLKELHESEGARHESLVRRLVPSLADCKALFGSEAFAREAYNSYKEEAKLI